VDIAPGLPVAGTLSFISGINLSGVQAKNEEEAFNLPLFFPAPPLPALGFDQHGFRRYDYDPRHVPIDQNNLPGVSLSATLFREKELNG
jgi:hypothetical protein